MPELRDFGGQDGRELPSQTTMKVMKALPWITMAGGGIPFGIGGALLGTVVGFGIYGLFCFFVLDPAMFGSEDP